MEPPSNTPTIANSFCYAAGERDPERLVANSEIQVPADRDSADSGRNLRLFYKEKQRSWGPISVEVVKRALGEATDLSVCHRLTYMLNDFEAVLAADDHPARHFRLRRGHFVYRPPDTTLRSYLTAGRYVRILQTRETYDHIAREILHSGVFRPEPRYALNDPLISQLVLTIANEIAGDVLDHILADSLNTALAVRIVRCLADPSAIAPPPSNGLSSERLRRVRDYVEAHLADPLNLHQIAEIACLSPYHFSRSFKQALGVGPHDYVVERRVERAKRLIRRTSLPLGLIAQEAGFTDQSHLTSVFRRKVGVTPGRFRAAAL